MLAGETRSGFAACATWGGDVALGAPTSSPRSGWAIAGGARGGIVGEEGHRRRSPSGRAGRGVHRGGRGHRPGRGGRYALGLDVVHEHVRWFECETRVVMDVHAAGAPRAAGSPAVAAMTLRPVGPRPEPDGRRRRRVRARASLIGANVVLYDDTVLEAGCRDRPRRRDRQAAPAPAATRRGPRRPGRPGEVIGARAAVGCAAVVCAGARIGPGAVVADGALIREGADARGRERGRPRLRASGAAP